MSNYMIKTLKRYKPKLSYFEESNKIFFEGTQELSSRHFGSNRSLKNT